MFIVCPKCFTKYLISDEIQVLETQKCHCSACGHYFEQKAIKILQAQKKLLPLPYVSRGIKIGGSFPE